MNSSDNKYFQLFSMNTDNIPLPVKLNNPFNAVIPEIAKIAAKEVQNHLENFPPDHDFGLRSDTGLGLSLIHISEPTRPY